MGRIAYVNGRYARHAEAAVHIEDRGYQFADAIYEVWALVDGRFADDVGHFERLKRSLGELEIPMPMSETALRVVLRETVRRNGVRDGLVYLQISRGQAKRDHPFPDPAPVPAVVITVKAIDPAALAAKAEKGGAVITTPDIRWGRCDIKTVGLLPNAMAKTAARRAGAIEAWLVDKDGLVTEGSSTNAWIVDENGVLRTRDIGANILRGVTRASLLELARSLQLAVEERPFTVDEAKRAREAFFTAASAFVTPVTAIDGKPVGDGQPGPVALRLRALYMEKARQNAAP
jgi:D-alanine transaminase